MDKNDEIVTFEDAQGNVISNDPRWRAMKELGLLNEDGSVPKAAAKAATKSAPKKAAEKPAATPEPEAEEEAEDDDEDLSDDETEEVEESEETPDYKDLDGKALKTLAKERGVDTTGFTKASQFRNALIENDKA